MNTTTTKLPEDSIEAICDLHTKNIDAVAGFETMIDKAEPEFQPIAQQYHALHRSHAAKLRLMLEKLGTTPDDEGSFMSMVNRTVVSVRAFFDEIDDDVMSHVRSGEKSILDAYDEALEEPLPLETAAEIRGLKAELTDLLSRTSHLD